MPALADPLRIGGVSYPRDFPTFVAERDGHFARHHADVEVTSHGSGRETLRQFRSGELDFALMAMTPLVSRDSARHFDRAMAANDYQYG